MSYTILTTQTPTNTATYAVTSGTLPTGLTLNSSTGIISGTPSTTGYNVSGVTTTVTITATNTITGNATAKAFNILRKWYDGTSEASAASSANYIKNLTATSTNGYYWIKPTGYSTALQVHCDMANSGGAWMLMSYTGINNNKGTHVEDPQINYPFNINGTATAITDVTDPPTFTHAGVGSGNLGQPFIDRLVVNGRSTSPTNLALIKSNGIGLFRIKDSGGTWRNYYMLADANANWYPVHWRNAFDTERRSNTLGPGNTWLKTSYPTYATDATYAGTLSGSTTTTAADGWNTYPGNMSNGNSENWGYSSNNLYTDGAGRGYTPYNSSHSNGWNRPSSFWLKII